MAKRIGADKPRNARTLDEALGAALTQMRVKKGWSQLQFAELVGFDEGYMRQIERGIKSPTLRTLKHISDALSISTSALIRAAERRLP